MKRHFHHPIVPSESTVGNYRIRVIGIFISVCLFFYMGTFAHGAELVAEITAFEGDVIVLTDSKAVRVEMAGHPLNEGDLIQTKEGSTEVTFADGAIITISPYTTTRIQVKQEESGFWIFKTKATVRRITCFIGKLRFKSGSEIKKNYLQTPTATAGVRGSEGEIGFNNVESFINMIAGEYNLIGEFVQGFFENPGADAAAKSQVYQTLLNAYETYQEAESSGNADDLAQAALSGLEAIKAAAEEMLDNPDPSVAQDAQDVLTIVNTKIEDIESAGYTDPTGGDGGGGGGGEGVGDDGKKDPTERENSPDATTTTTTSSTTSTTTTEPPTTTTEETTTTTSTTTEETTTTTTTEETTTTTEAPSSGDDSGSSDPRFIYNASPTGYEWTSPGDDNYIKLTNGSTSTDLENDPIIKFSFPFYGKEYTEVFVGSNGYVTFSKGDREYDPDDPTNDPSGSTEWWQFKDGPPRIAPLWTVLDFRTSTTYPENGTLTVESTNSFFRVTWDNVDYYSYYDGNNQASFSTTLYQSGWIVFSYGDVGTDDHPALVGLSPGSGDVGHPGEGETRRWLENLDLSTLDTHVYFYNDANGNPVYEGLYEYWSRLDEQGDEENHPFDLSNSYIIFRPESPSNLLTFVSAETIVDINSLDTAILWSDTNDDLFESNYIPGQFSTTGTTFNFPGTWSGGTYKSAEDESVYLGLQLLGTDSENDTPKLFVDSNTQDAINRNGFLAYAVQVEEDRVNQEILDLHKSIANANVQQSVNNALASGTIRSRDDLLMQIADAQAGRVLKDQEGKWVRVGQYVLKGNDDKTVQVLNVTLRGNNSSQPGMSTIDFRTTFSESLSSGVSLRSLPWSNWLNTQTNATTGSRYVNTTENAPVLDNMSVRFTNPGTDYFQEIRAFDDRTPAPYIQPITNEQIDVNGTAYTHELYTGSSNNTYSVDHNANGENPYSLQYMLKNPTVNFDIAFYILGDTDEGVSDDPDKPTKFQDIWDVFRVNDTGAKQIGNKNLEIVVDSVTGGISNPMSNPIDVVFIPMSRMLWKSPQT